MLLFVYKETNSFFVNKNAPQGCTQMREEDSRLCSSHLAQQSGIFLVSAEASFGKLKWGDTLYTFKNQGEITAVIVAAASCDFCDRELSHR